MRQVSNLTKKLQMKVSYLEARMVPSTPQEVRDRREADPKSAVASMLVVVEQYEKLLGESDQTWSELEEHDQLQKV